jgi:osmotically-inducible protein OsmY
MKTDRKIGKNVEDELRSDPKVDATHIAVAVRNGSVVLTGFVRNYLQKIHAERDATRVVGTRIVANDIEVRLPYINKRSDPEIVGQAVEKLKMELPYSSQFIMVTAKDGWLKLEGTLEWNYQRAKAEKVVCALCGVIGVSNEIVLKPAAAASGIKNQIEDAMKRSVELDARQITVESAGMKITLRGGLRSWANRTQAERAT